MSRWKKRACETQPGLGGKGRGNRKKTWENLTNILKKTARQDHRGGNLGLFFEFRD
jgi:hypothetical protein